MKPGDNATNDSLISGIGPQTPPVPQEGGAAVLPPQPINLPAAPAEETVVQTIPEPVGSLPAQDQPTSPFIQASPPQVQQPQPMTQTAEQPMASAFTPPQESTARQDLPVAPAEMTQTPGTPSFTPQPTSPFDTPPAPPQQAQPVQNTANLQGSIAEEKPKKKPPVFLIILLFLVVIVLGVVGYLAYQNFILNKDVTSSVTQPPLQTPTVTDTNPYSGYTAFGGSLLPVEFMVPSGWVTEETDDPDLGNQKMIRSTSSDFIYQEGAIASGFEFRVGPVSDLTKKYDSFEAYTAEENADNSHIQRSINQINWLIKGNEAKTLLDSTPLIVSLYSGGNQAASAPEIFTKILNSFKLTSETTPTTAPNPLPTSASLE